MTAPSGLCLLAPIRGGAADWPAATQLDMQPIKAPRTTAAAVAVRRQQILDFITAYVAEHGYSPSLREVGAAVGVRSVSTVANHVWRLRLAGRLAPAAERKRARVLRPVEPGGVA